MDTAYSRDELLASASDLDDLGLLEKPVTPFSVFDAIAGSVRDTVRLVKTSRGQATPAPRVPQPCLQGAEVLLVEMTIADTGRRCL